MANQVQLMIKTKV